MTISIRGGFGIGDSLYVQAIARHLINRGETVEVCTAWPDLFIPLGDKVTISSFRKLPVDRIAHYSPRKEKKDTDQFQDCCIQAGINEPVELAIDWEPRNQELIERISSEKPVIVVAMPREPFNRGDNYGIELLPRREAMQAAIDVLKDKTTLVQIGKGEPIYKLDGIDIDLSNQTSVTDLLDIGYTADGFFGQPSYIIPLGESFFKPVFCVWASAGMKSHTRFIRLVRPQKVFHRITSTYVTDSASKDQIAAGVHEFLEHVGRKRVFAIQNDRSRR